MQGSTLQAVALVKLHQFSAGERKLAEADALCASYPSVACGAVLRAKGIFAMQREEFGPAHGFFLQYLAFERTHGDRWLEANALLNLGVAALQADHSDEAVDWFRAASQAGTTLDNDNLMQGVSGNLGWAYFKLGDKERALELFLDAGQHATRLGNIRAEMNWLRTAGYVYQDLGHFTEASASYATALQLAREIGSRQDVIDALEDQAHNALDRSDPALAATFIDQAAPLVRETGNHLDQLDLSFAEGRIAVARHQDAQAEQVFHAVQQDPGSQTSMQLGAGHELARLYELEGDTAAADRTYKATLRTFAAAQDQLRNEESKLPFLANATRIYDDYIHFLVTHGEPEEALAAADQSRARTLAQGLGLPLAQGVPSNASLHPNTIARATGSTLLFYWLGEKQSYLWAVTPTRTSLYPLPARSVIAASVDRYRATLLGPEDPLESSMSNNDGRLLYNILVAPAKDLIPAGAQVVTLTDGPLNNLNFETLIVSDAAHPEVALHYWIEDATLLSAPSLLLLGSAQPEPAGNRKLLLIGDAVSPGPEYPQLPMARTEMQQIAQHFPPAQQTVLSRSSASPDAYLQSSPERYGYIHFVTHALASSSDPLDSSILLSRNAVPDDSSFKLYARHILEHPIHAQLVTISACYGSGTRSYAGEGLVGLSWAFLRAGAHNVIAALWEVSDDSSPQLMNTLYAGLEDGLKPSAALHQAKLSLLHSGGEFRRPYYWAPFQLYSGL